MVDFKTDQLVVLGSDGGQGNLLAVQADMRAVDYRSAASFADKLSGYLQMAQAQGWLNRRTIAVFPEYIGTWLVAAGEGPAVWEAAGLRQAMQALVLAHPLAFARNFVRAREKGRMEAALFRLKAASMARIYTNVFSDLARQFGVTVVAGSILLPEPTITAGCVEPGQASAPLQNVSAVFQPDGQIHPWLARKCFPIQDEQPFVASARLSELPSFETPAGRLGVLVCADSWFPQAYAQLAASGIELLAVPSYINHAGAWDKPWGGYSGWPEAADVIREDIGGINEGQAWRKYALGGRLASSGARAGVNVFLQGSLWDMGADGASLIVKQNEAMEAQPGQGALLNMWL
jgi:predicted amidohydrolase